MPDPQRLTRLESGPFIKLLAAISIAGVVALAIYAFATGNGLAVGLLITLVIAGVTGMVLERIDSSRKRKPGSEGTRDEHWGFRGRPGS